MQTFARNSISTQFQISRIVNFQPHKILYGPWLKTEKLNKVMEAFVSGLNAWIVMFGVEHDEYLEAVDLTSYVGAIPTWLASYFLV